MQTVRELIMGIQEELNLHQDFQEGKSIYYLEVCAGAYGEYQDIVKVIKTKVRNIGVEYDGEKSITLEYGFVKIPERLFKNKLYVNEEDLRIALTKYLEGTMFLEKSAGVSVERYHTYLRPKTSATLANSKDDFTKDEYILYLDTSNLHRQELSVTGVCYNGLEEGKYLLLSNGNVEKDLDNLDNYYGKSEFSQLVNDIIDKLISPTQDDEISEYIAEEVSSDLNLDDLLKNDEFIDKLLRSDKVINCLANAVLNRGEDDFTLNKLSSHVGKALISKL